MRSRPVLAALLCLLCAACGSSSHRVSRTPSTAPPALRKLPHVDQKSPPSKTTSAAAHPLVGIGDNNVLVFDDPRFRALGITEVRDDIPWDILRTGGYPRARLAQWLALAHAEKLSVLITFDRSGRQGGHYTLPTVAQYSTAFLEFRKLYPWVTQFVTWDEANFYGEPTSTHPGRAARYYEALRSDCPTCTILAPDLLDMNDRRYAVPELEYARELMADLPSAPTYWALNDYVGANDLSTSSTEQLLRSVPGKVWIVEVAGIINNGTHAEIASAASLQHEATVDRFILDKLAALSGRIQRIYLYEWRAASAHDLWDSALIAASGQPRPAYDILAETLDAWGIKPDCKISSAPPACNVAAGRS
jgi:hypothetical protein